MTNKYGKIISLLLINMMFLLPACRRTEISHLIEPQVKADINQEQVKECIENKRNKWHVFLIISILVVPFGFLTLGVIHDLYYKDGHWIPNLIPNHVPA
jgi:hypothetical protein